MRLGTQKIMRAFNNRKSLTVGKTKTDGTSIWLHGNKIVERRSDGIWISNAGIWNSNTTKERLNGLPNVHVQQKNFQWYLNGIAWDGRWVNVERWDSWFVRERQRQLYNSRSQYDETGNLDLLAIIIPEPETFPWDEIEPEPEPEPEPEIEFDMTNAWIEEGQYSKPLYAVTHKLSKPEIEPLEKLLNDSGIPTKQMESDTSGVYKPNYFIVVRPDDFTKATNILKENEK